MKGATIKTPILERVQERLSHCKFILLLLMLCVAVNSTAQKVISLKQAIDTALKNNISVKNDKLKAAYQEQLIKTSANIPQANLVTEFGQINSIYTDTRFGISQSFSFPTVYSNQKKVLKEDWKSSVLNIAVKESELKRSVAQLYYYIAYLKEKENLLQKADSIYAAFLSKASLRYQQGETNLLEKTTAETQRGGVQMQLKALQQELKLSLLQLQLLLNTTTLVTTDGKLKIASAVLVDSAAINNHPLIQITTQQKVVAQATTRLEKAKLLPDLNVAYYNSSIKGTGADNVYYNASSRFSSAQIGIGIPLFNSAQKAKINAAGLNETIADNAIQQQLKTLKSSLQIAESQYESSKETVRYFEQEALPNATVILQTADKQFANGEINYLEWVMLVNQSATIQNNYLDAVKVLNESVLTIEYLTSKL